MNEQLPAPMTPPECDLRGLDYMPLFGNHLFGSEFNAAASDSEWRAAVTLWWAAWNQVPAGSLPNDDVALCRLADLGRDVKTWKKLRERALHGFILCSDGRLYHGFLAKQASIAWDLRQAERMERENEKQRKARERQRRARMFADLEAAGITPPWNTTGTELSRLHAEHCPPDGHEPVTRTDTAKTGRDGTGRDDVFPIQPTVGGSPSPAADGPPPLLADETPSPTGIPPCDHRGVLELWRQFLPSNPQPAKWTPTRAKHLQARWRELFAEGKANSRDEALAWFGRFFRYLAKSPFLTGRVTPREPGRPPFVLELHRLIEPEFWVQCIEGKYHQET